MPTTSKKIPVELSPKSIRYVLRALDLQLRELDSRLRSPSLSEDEEADLRNDQRLFEIIRETFAGALPPPPSE